MKQILNEWKRFLNEQIKKTSIFYHLSPVKFNIFKQQLSEPGFHFGTKETALTVAHKLFLDEQIKIGDVIYLYEVDLKINNSLLLPENRLGSWSVSDILLELFEGNDGEAYPFISEEQIEDYYDDIVLSPSGENIKDLTFQPEEEIKEFIKWFKAFGYDSIKYENTYEGWGISYIVFEPRQIQILNIKPMKYVGTKT